MGFLLLLFLFSKISSLLLYILFFVVFIFCLLYFICCYFVDFYRRRCNSTQLFMWKTSYWICGKCLCALFPFVIIFSVVVFFYFIRNQNHTARCLHMQSISQIICAEHTCSITIIWHRGTITGLLQYATKCRIDRAQCCGAHATIAHSSDYTHFRWQLL